MPAPPKLLSIFTHARSQMIHFSPLNPPMCQLRVRNVGYNKINGFGATLLFQQDQGTLLFGQRNQLSKYTADYGFPRDLDDDLKECLSSQKPFFRQNSGGRGAR